MENQDISVGIIMRTKNRPVLLQRALQSVLNQNYTNWQLVVVNDGGNSAVVDNLITQIKKEFHHIDHLDKKIIVIHNENSLGMEAASNKGIAAIETDLLIIHDDDDSWSPVFLQRMVVVFLKEKQLLPSIEGIICHSNRVIEEINGNIIKTNQIESFNTWIQAGLIPIERMLLENMFPPISFLFSKKAYDNIRGFNENLPVLGDWDFNIRFILKYDIWVLPELLAFYHHRTNINSGDNGNSVIAQKDVHYKYRKYLLNEYFRQSPQIGIFIAQREYFSYLMKESNTPFGYSEESNDTYEYQLAIRRINFLYEKLRKIYRSVKKILGPFIFIKNALQKLYHKAKSFIKHYFLDK